MIACMQCNCHVRQNSELSIALWLLTSRALQFLAPGEHSQQRAQNTPRHHQDYASAPPQSSHDVQVVPLHKRQLVLRRVQVGLPMRCQRMLYPVCAAKSAACAWAGTQRKTRRRYAKSRGHAAESNRPQDPFPHACRPFACMPDAKTASALTDCLLHRRPLARRQPYRDHARSLCILPIPQHTHDSLAQRIRQHVSMADAHAKSLRLALGSSQHGTVVR